MIKRLFKNNIFIFILTFSIEFIMFYLFNHLNIGGRYLNPDMALSPFFGLVFGPVGGLGYALATFVSELKAGCILSVCLIDSIILFFISILPYKLWYLFFKEKDLTTPRFNSTYNILKLLIIMAITSGVYLILLRISFLAFPEVMSDLYSISNFRNQFSYAFDIFDFAILYSFIFITMFNFAKIPLKKPKGFKSKLKIPYRLFFIPFVIVVAYILLRINIPVANYIMFALSFITIFLFAINSFDVKLVEMDDNYSIIEKIIVGFLLVMLISSYQLLDDSILVMHYFKYNLNVLDKSFIFMISLGVVLAVAVVFTIIHIYFVERIITNPLNKLNRAVKNYIVDGKLSNQNKVTFNFRGLMKNDDDIIILIDSFNKLGTIIKDNLKELKKTTADKERLETEFNVARKIQTNMLSDNFEEFAENKSFKIYGSMNPAKEVGGDFYDYIDVDDENIAFVIGDVSGKGISAALFMVKIMFLIKNHSRFEVSSSDVINQVNDLACEKNNNNLFVTSWFSKFNYKTGDLSFVNAGHNPPLIMRNGGDFEYLQDDNNIPLGIMDDFKFKEVKIKLNPGDIIFLYTDGVTEANDDYNGFYGEERLINKLNKNKYEDVDKIIDEIKNDINQFCNGVEQFDDLTMFIFKYEGVLDDV